MRCGCPTTCPRCHTPVRPCAHSPETRRCRNACPRGDADPSTGTRDRPTSGPLRPPRAARALGRVARRGPHSTHRFGRRGGRASLGACGHRGLDLDERRTCGLRHRLPRLRPRPRRARPGRVRKPSRARIAEAGGRTPRGVGGAVRSGGAQRGDRHGIGQTLEGVRACRLRCRDRRARPAVRGDRGHGGVERRARAGRGGTRLLRCRCRAQRLFGRRRRRRSATRSGRGPHRFGPAPADDRARESPMTEFEGPDLLVAGAGGGLAGALRAAEQGLSVVVVEASPHFRRGNNTSMSTAMFPGAGTRWQAEAGVEDSPDRFVADIMAKTGGQAEPRLARTLAEVSGPLVEWLADSVGLPLSLVTDFNYPGHAVPRCHSIPGRHGSRVVDHLARKVDEHPDIDLLTPARLVAVRTDSGGVVRAGVVRYPDGTEEEIPTGAVLLATNGFGANRELVARHLPEIADALYQGSDQSLGDALRIGTELGAATGFLDAYQGHGAVSPAAGTLVGWATIIHGGVLVDRTGRRFGDETRGYSEYAAELAARPGATGWIVLDEVVHEQCLPFQDYRDTVA